MQGPPVRCVRGMKRFETTDAQALQYMNSTTTHGRVLKLADGIMQFPKKKRFNQDLDESIQDVKSQMDEKSRYSERPSALKTFIERNKSDASVFDGRTISQNSIQSGKKSKFSTLSKE